MEIFLIFSFLFNKTKIDNRLLRLSPFKGEIKKKMELLFIIIIIIL